MSIAIRPLTAADAETYESVGFKTYGIEERAMKIDGRYIDDELMVLFL